jgi:hypothetical protein
MELKLEDLAEPVKGVAEGWLYVGSTWQFVSDPAEPVEGVAEGWLYVGSTSHFVSDLGDG